MTTNLPVLFLPRDLLPTPRGVGTNATDKLCIQVLSPTTALALESGSNERGHPVSFPPLTSSSHQHAIIANVVYLVVLVPDTRCGTLRCDDDAASLSRVVELANARCAAQQQPSAVLETAATAFSFGHIPHWLQIMARLLNLTVASNALRWEQASLTLFEIGRHANTLSDRRWWWLDLACGAALVAWAGTMWGPLSSQLFQVVGYYVQSQVLHERVVWIMQNHAPLGFKLNPQVDQVLGRIVLLVVDAWQVVTSLVAPVAGRLLLGAVALAWLADAVVSGGRPRGASLVAALAFDAVTLVTLHVSVLHRILSRLLGLQLALLTSLGLALAGRKRNPLRSRVDHLPADRPRLLLATMLFPLVAFTLQTTLAHHLLILSVWLLVCAVQAALWAAAVACDSLPRHVAAAWCFAPPDVVNASHAFPQRVSLVLTDKGWALQSHAKPPSAIAREWLQLLGAEWKARRDVRGVSALGVLLGWEALPGC